MWLHLCACCPADWWAVVDNGFVPGLSPPYKPRSPTTRASCVPLLPMHLQERWNPIKPVLAHPAFRFLLYQLCMPGPESNNTLSPKIWRTRCQMRLEPHHPPCLSWGTCRAGIRRCWLPWSKGKFCRAYDGFVFLVRNHAVHRQPNLDIKNYLQGSCLGNRGPLFSFSIRDIFAWLKTKVHVWNANVKSPSTCSH